MSMIKINPSVQAAVPVVSPDKTPASAGKTQAAPAAAGTSVHIAPDSIKVGSAPRSPSAMEPVKFFDAPAASGSNKEKDSPWKIKSVHINAGYIANQNIIHTGPMHIKNDQYNTDVHISGIKQVPRYNWSNIDPTSGDRFAPDEPQNVLGVNIEFANKFGLELDAKHNKVIVGDYNQIVHFDGMINGTYVNQDAPLNTFMQQHEQTYGNEQVSCLATRTFDLPAPGNHRFAYIVKAGPSMIITTSRTSVLNGDHFDQTTSGFGVAGWGATVENGLRYEFGPKLGRAGLEVAYALSYLDYCNYPVVGGGTGSHNAVAGQLTVKLSKSFEINRKNHSNN